ncbi:DUF4918 family protein, partial [Candidatus Uhrbacteria bacterium]|nr:DUF4918 family protein [Candidatus Uhrbacteria bacterium]
ATKTCVILGKNKNYQTFQKLNNSLRLFDKVFVLEHPRYIMQYRRKETHRFVLEYCNVFRQAEK